ncbi:MAG: efflux RND transporter permease subunit [Acidobacteriota bacterium]|nr:efflux RND transporter permease subunit [Acidobacteriota bacterium]
MKLVSFSVRRPVSVFIFAVAAVVFGLVAFRRLATDLLPDITYPSISVRTTYEGAAPLEVENLISRPVENAIGVVNNVVRVVSSSRPDLSEVTLEFAWGTSMDLAALDVRERLDVLELPTDAERPILLRYDPALDPIMRLGLTGLDDLVHLRLVADERVKRSLERIDGVAAVVVSGGLEEEIQVELDERRLANLGLSADLVLNRLAQENINLTGGRLREGQTEYLVRTVNEFVRAEDLETVVVDSSRGAVVRLEDVAHVVRGYRDREIITRINGSESVEVAIYKEGGTNTVTVSDATRTGLDQLAARLVQIDPALELTVVTDQARYIRQSVSEVLQTAVYGGLLAILVLFLFLRSWKTTSIIGIAIPISVVASFFLMFASGISLNIMSLGGLTLGIGLLVDNSIVVLEAIQRRRDEGMGELEAAERGTGEVARAVVASTLTTICVFVPIVFVEGIAGQLFGDQALTVTYSLSISLLVALTVIPMLASRGSRGSRGSGADVDADDLDRNNRDRDTTRSGAERLALSAGVGAARAFNKLASLVGRTLAAATSAPLRFFERAFDSLASFYDRFLKQVLDHPGLTLLLAVVLLALSLMLVPSLGRELVPELVQGEFFVNTELPPGTHLDVTQRRLASLEQTAAELEGVQTVYTVAGTSSEQGGVAGETRENIGQMTLVLAPPRNRDREEGLMAELRRALNRQEALEYRFGRPSYFSFRTPVEVEIRGYNLALLKTLAENLADQMKSIPGLTDVKSSTEGGNPELQVRFDRNRLATYSLTLGQVADLLRSKVQGTVATEIQRADRQIDIRVRSGESYRDSVRDLLALTVHQRGKTAIPLSALAEVSEIEGPAEIRRAEGERVAVVTANLVGSDLGTVSEKIASTLDATEMPSGFDWRIGGQRQEMETSFDSMRLAIFLAIFMVYLVMASQFESLLHPLVILFSVPFALIGVVVTLALFKVRISIVVLIGAILLAGIVVNNAILLIDATNRLRREGRAKIEALREAGSRRLRPILMTTATTVLGLTPMAIGLGEGSELRSPMALTVIGGLLTSTLLTLLIIPAVYNLLDRKP